jgi:hypothetical protein
LCQSCALRPFLLVEDV